MLLRLKGSLKFSPILAFKLILNCGLKSKLEVVLLFAGILGLAVVELI